MQEQDSEGRSEAASKSGSKRMAAINQWKAAGAFFTRHWAICPGERRAKFVLFPVVDIDHNRVE